MMPTETVRFYLLYSKEPVAGDLSAVVQESKAHTLSGSILNDIPPPPREIILDVSSSSIEEIFEETLQRVVGIVVDEGICFKDGLLHVDVLRKLSSAFNRARRQNPIVEFHGFYVAIFSRESSLQKQAKIIADLESFKWSSGDGLPVRIEVIDGPETMSVFLRGQFRRVAASEALYMHEAFA